MSKSMAVNINIGYSNYLHTPLKNIWSKVVTLKFHSQVKKYMLFSLKLDIPFSAFPCNAALLTLYRWSWCMGGTTAPQHQLGSAPRLGHQPQFNRQINLPLLR